MRPLAPIAEIMGEPAPSARPRDSVWPATHVPAKSWDANSAPSPTGTWVPLGQSWLSGGTERGFRAGQAQITWHEQALVFDLVFHGQPAGNRARRLNERTWELGDIGEVFLQINGRADYWEFHVTPENQRLQLHWSQHGLAAFRAGSAPLEQFTLGPEASLLSTATVEADGWRATLVVPAATLGLTGFTAGPGLRTTVCRYDCTGSAAPVCSSTAPLRELSFHRLGEWTGLTLCPP